MVESQEGAVAKIMLHYDKNLQVDKIALGLTVRLIVVVGTARCVGLRAEEAQFGRLELHYQSFAIDMRNAAECHEDVQHQIGYCRVEECVMLCLQTIQQYYKVCIGKERR